MGTTDKTEAVYEEPDLKLYSPVSLNSVTNHKFCVLA